MNLRTTILCAALAFVLAVGASSVYAQAGAAGYKGSTMCMMCHKNQHKAVVEGYQKSFHQKAMQKADVPGAIVGDFSKNALFTKDKVAYTLGSGQAEQSYLDAKLQVLPGSWDVKSKSWKAVHAVDGSTQCVGCHTTGYDPAKKTFTQAGVGCESCHGPGAEHMSSPKTKSVVKPQTLNSKQQSMICGQCHSVGKSTDGTHAFPIGFVPGGDLSKSFVDAKPTSAGRNQQYSDFSRTKHFESGVSCTTCHEPHGGSGNPARLKKPINEQCLDCHATKIVDMATHAPKAPEGATCATCHMPDGRHTFSKP